MIGKFSCNCTNKSKKRQSVIISCKRYLNRRIKLGYVSAWALGFTLWAISFFLIKKWQSLLIKQPLFSQQDNADGQLAVEDANSSASTVETNNPLHSHATDSEVEDTHSPASAVEGLKEHTTALRENGNDKSLLVFPLTFLLFVIVKDAWLSDDSFITLRVVDNFIHGYGLTWNIDERVQTYTHPLWMFCLSLVYFFTHEFYYSTLVLSVTLSLIAVGIFGFYLARSTLLAGLGIMTLAASKAFVDFSTSGLENSLTYLLIVFFMLIFYTRQQNKHYIFYLALIAGLATLNRMDTLLFFLPALIFVFYKSPRLKSVKAMLLGFSPLLCWEVFSLWYYGFLFPNTAYAKLDTGIDSAQLLQQGVGYFVSSFSFDPILFLIIAASIFSIFLQREWKSLPFIIGVGLYLLYTLSIGGDFMAGRFLTEPYLIAVILLARTPFPSLTVKSNWVLALVVIALFGFLPSNSRWYPINLTKPSNILFDKRGVEDERAFYESGTALVNMQHGIPWPNFTWLQQGLQAKRSHERVTVFDSIGMFGTAAGPSVHVVDPFALGDPLLARLPALPNWNIGHFARHIPEGYLETLRSGKNVIQDRDLALYYSKLQYITRGPLFDFQRLIEIWKFNTGAYNYLLSHYSHSDLSTALVAPNRTGDQSSPYSTPMALTTGYHEGYYD